MQVQQNAHATFTSQTEVNRRQFGIVRKRKISRVGPPDGFLLPTGNQDLFPRMGTANDRTFNSRRQRFLPLVVDLVVTTKRDFSRKSPVQRAFTIGVVFTPSLSTLPLREQPLHVRTTGSKKYTAQCQSAESLYAEDRSNVGQQIIRRQKQQLCRWPLTTVKNVTNRQHEACFHIELLPYDVVAGRFGAETV